ncbi:AMP-binding protein [Trebonia sp.]|uniref:AMP-binding protein n=1 Tax=Trebonia sp. TaxID=2767075 RepID=UPI003CC62FD2
MALSASYWAADRSQPVLGLTVGDALRDAAAEAPDTTALVEGAVDPAARRRWSYAGLLEAAERAACALMGRFTPGDRVAVWANNIPEWVILELAAGLAGITIVTVNPALRPQELAYVLGQSQADGIFLVPAYRASPMAEMVQQVRGALPALREAVSFEDWEAFCAEAAADRTLPAVSPDAPAQIQYTSGTTGFPKGAVLHHRGIVNNARLYTARLGLGRGNVYLSGMPLFHTAGCVMSVLGAVATRGTLILPPYFDPGLMLELIAAERPQTLLGVPTMLIGMLDHPGFAATDLSSIRQLLTGGAVVPPALVSRVEAAFGAPLSIVFAQTEASPVITQTSPQDSAEDRAHTLGRPLPQTEVKITDPASGQTVAPGKIGELCTRGYHVMTGYFRDPGKTAAAIDADGWLHTGDLASMDERGYCQISGRLKDMIIRGGENIYPREIEQVLFEHPAVADVAVVGVPDATWGEQVAAFVRPAPGHRPDPGELFAYCREHLAPHKTPRYWTVMEEFPLTPSGKVQKFVLRERFLAQGPDVAIRAESPDTAIAAPPAS